MRSNHEELDYYTTTDSDIEEDDMATPLTDAEKRRQISVRGIAQVRAEYLTRKQMKDR